MATFKQYTASGGATEPFSISTFSSDEIKVRVDGVLKTAATHYNITSYTANGGTVTWTSGNVPSSGTVRIYRDTGIASAKATYQAGSSMKADDLNDNQTQVLRAIEEKDDQLIQNYELEDNVVTTSKMAFNTLDELADQVTANEPTWLTQIGVVAGDIGFTGDMGSVSDAIEAAPIGSINTVASNITSVNRYAEEYKISSSAPSSPSAGDLWYDTSNNKLKLYNASGWIDVAVGANPFVVDQSAKQTDSLVYYDGSEFKADSTTTKSTLVHGGSF